MTAEPMDRPLRPVWTTQDAQDAQQGVQSERQRWAAFLTAKDLLLGFIKTTGTTVSEVFDRWHLGGAVRGVKRAAGWLFGGLAMLHRGLTTAGVRPGIAWLLSTPWGQSVVTKAAKAVTGVVTTMGRTVLRAVSWTLGLFGARGRKSAVALQSRAHHLRVALGGRLRSARENARAILHTDGLPMQAVRTFAKGRVLTALLTRFLSGPWSILGRVVANVAVLPASVRREALRMLTGTVGKPEGPQDPTPPASPAAKKGPEGPTPPVSPAAKIVDIAERRGAYTDLEQTMPNSLQRYPAGKSTGAKRKR